MTSVSTVAHSKAMAPEERKDLAEISSGAIPKLLPMAWAAQSGGETGSIDGGPTDAIKILVDVCGGRGSVEAEV